MNTPLVSIIIPVYNGENYLRDAIESALAQTYPHIEIIVVNDGSSDQGATQNIALSYDGHIRYLHKPNGGVATALNLGIREMKGEYFSWLSHDDLYYSTKIEHQMNALQTHGNMQAIVYSDYDLQTVDTQTLTHIQLSKTYSNQQLKYSVFPVLQGIVNGCSLLIHKSHFERVGVFNEQLVTSQDYDLWFRLMRYQTTVYIPESLMLSRIHSAQGSQTIPRFHHERDQLHMNFMKQLTDDEMKTMYGNAYNFYHRMSCYFKGGNMLESFNYANEKLQQSEIPAGLSNELKRLNEYITALSAGKAKQICIFGAGEYGVRLYQELRSKLIKVDFFSDNNPAKHGYLFDNISCLDLHQLEMQKEDTLVIVASRTPTGIVDQLKSKNFPYLITKQEMDRILIQVPPVKWVTALDSIEGIDYSSTDVVLLLRKFNQTIYDICKYYESRTNTSN